MRSPKPPCVLHDFCRDAAASATLVARLCQAVRRAALVTQAGGRVDDTRVSGKALESRLRSGWVRHFVKLNQDHIGELLSVEHAPKDQAIVVDFLRDT